LSSVRDYVAQTDTFDLPLVLVAGFATPSMSTLAMSTLATWCRDVHSREVHSRDFSASDNFAAATLILNWSS